MNRRCRAAVWIAALAIGAPVGAQETWNYELAAFVWAASIEGRQGVNSTVVDVEADFDDLLELADIGAALRIEARREPVTWFVEGNFVVLEDDVATRAGAIRAEVLQSYAEGGLSYEFREQLAVYGALRFQRLDTEFQGAFGNLQDDKE